VNYGDTWPAVDLASVSFAAEASSATAAIGGMKSRLRMAQPMAMQLRKFRPFLVTPWKPGSDLSRAVAPDRSKPTATSTSISDHSSMHMLGSKVNEHPQTSTKDVCENVAGKEDRIIALAIHVDPTQQIEDFKIGADCAKFMGADWKAHVDAAKKSAASFGRNSVVLRARAGRSETWTIVNDPQDSNHETHNFHVHQMKFEVVDVYDPTQRITPPRGDPKAKRMVDSYPVPIGGYLRIRINFTKQMTGGRFVFHCHILEHEDKGMMAEIEVK
jgi:FtsP/CotA-like multicopper oxidase with cupredoxin domain